ncbi:hypothetical protein VB834_05100 [Limnoraphis robusta Tam1]|jgi:hypothetical protein|uniref:hypothetical protein n=1 Tax=Limnoraphis robusta TaxID=1118279 RepID=UPI002B2003C2|nr:hypothetical protein [Limnoraphis robusta]MEA5538406.1 hypothetical protein [Limnoraphis robusta Tam1]
MDKPENKKPTPKPQENLNDDAKQIDAMAKAIIVGLTWSLAGLTTPKKPVKTQQDAPEI